MINQKVSDEELEEMWSVLNYNHGKRIVHELTQYITERYLYWDRWVVHSKPPKYQRKSLAKNDPIAIPKIGELLASEIPNNEIYWMENTGHFLMLENPKEWSKLVLKSS